MPPDSDLMNGVVVAVEAQRLVEQRRARACQRQVHEDPDGSEDPLVVKRHLAIELDGDAHRVGKQLAPDRLDGGERGTRLRGRCLRRHSHTAGLRRRFSRHDLRPGRRWSLDTHQLRGNVRDQPARRIPRREQAKQADPSRSVPFLTEHPERVEREDARLPGALSLYPLAGYFCTTS